MLSLSPISMLKYATFMRRVSLLWSDLFTDLNLYHTGGSFQKKHAAKTVAPPWKAALPTEWISFPQK